MLVIPASDIEKDIGVFYMMHFRPILDAHVHDGFHEIMVMLRGSLTHTAGDQRVRVSAGDLIFLPNNSVHALSDFTPDLLFLNLCVSLSTFEQSMSYLRIAAAPSAITFSRVEPTVVDYLLWNHGQLMQTVGAAERTTLIRNTFSLLLPYCCDNRTEPDWFEKLLIQMRRQENFQAGVHRMQELAFCSPAHLCRVCKARTGLTPTQYVDKLRIQYACDLLKHIAYSIQDVCMECGYNNLGYFYRRFTQETGMPPGKYKEEHHMLIQSLI